MSPTLSSSNYNQATGVLTLTGKNLTTSAAGNWDSDSGASINTQAVSVNGLTPNTASLLSLIHI